MKEDKMPMDKNNQFHGYQEWYDEDEIWIRIVCKHGLDIGYEENHLIKKTTFYIR